MTIADRLYDRSFAPIRSAASFVEYDERERPRGSDARRSPTRVVDHAVYTS